MGHQFGDTTMTKVFVGGLAWETQKDLLRDHFEKYGDILEAVIISDKATGRSKGYGFVTFVEAESARKACEDPTPTINDRKANCNLASLGAKTRTRSSPPSTPGPNPTPLIIPARQGSRVVSNGLPPPLQWYYAPPTGTLHPPPAPQHYAGGVVPYYASAAAAYGYPPSYMTHGLGYNNAKVSPSGAPAGSYVSQYYPAQISPNAMVPMYPMCSPYHHHPQSQSTHAHFFPPAIAAAGAIPTVVVSKPAAVMPPTTVCMAVGQVTGCS